MPAKNETILTSKLFIQTTFNGHLNAILLASKEKLSTKKVAGGIKVSIPASLRKILAQQEAIVFKISE